MLDILNGSVLLMYTADTTEYLNWHDWHHRFETKSFSARTLLTMPSCVSTIWKCASHRDFPKRAYFCSLSQSNGRWNRPVSTVNSRSLNMTCLINTLLTDWFYLSYGKWSRYLTICAVLDKLIIVLIQIIRWSILIEHLFRLSCGRFNLPRDMRLNTILLVMYAHKCLPIWMIYFYTITIWYSIW